jgi:hypothetical protein
LELSGEGHKTVNAATNRMGEFTISGIEQGVYDLKVVTSEGTVMALGVPVIQEQ